MASVDDDLDRMMGLSGSSANGGGGSASASGSVPPEFIASSTWKGARKGYYFGTTAERGTGYYWDHAVNPRDKAATANGDGGDKPKKRKRVAINEAKNETRILKSGEELLREAEEAVDPHSKIIELTPRGLANATAALGKAVRKNALQRAKHIDNPSQYMESELMLHQQIAAFSAVAAASPSLYPNVLEGEQVLLNHFWALLSHENNDVALTVIHVLVEWLDPEQQQQQGNDVRFVADLAKAIVQGGLELILANLGRINASGDDETDQQGLEDIYVMVETLIEMELQGDRLTKDQSVAAWLVESTGIVSFLFGQLQSEDNRMRAAEVLSLVFQQQEVHSVLKDLTKIPPYRSILVDDEDDGDDNDDADDKRKKKKKRKKTKKEDTDGIEVLLQGIAEFRKKQPASEAECDYLENLVLAMASALTFSTTNVTRFIEAQGMELVIRCVRERVHTGGVGLSLLDLRNKKACEQLVAIGALKHIFPLFLGRSLPKAFSPLATLSSSTSTSAAATAATKKAKKEWHAKLESSMINIVYNFTRFLTDSSPKDAKQRLLVKFLEKDCEKCDRLVELLLRYDEKARKAEYKFYRSDAEDSLLDQDEVELAALDAKLQGGGDLFHRLGAVCAFCCINSKKCHQHILDQLTLQNSGIGVVKAAVQEFVSVLDDGEQKEQLEGYLGEI